MNSSFKTAESFFVFSEEEIEQKQIFQVGVSACGATAALNVLACFDIKVETDDTVNAVGTRLRKHKAPLPEYLKSRSEAGTTHVDIIKGIENLTSGQVKGKFFAFYPQRNINLHKFLLCWLKKGAVPIATLNLQKEQPSEGCRIADAWHHQMIYGVTEIGVHLCNPITTMPFEHIGKMLCSESILKIRLEDVLLRYDPEADLTAILDVEDRRWEALNVKGQITDLYGKIIKERSMNDGGRSITQLFMTEYVTIPAAYQSGITLFMQRDSKYFEEFITADDLPFETSIPCLSEPY